MEHTESPAPAQVVRKLNFSLNSYVNANANANLILPDHPQAHLQAKLLALAQSHKLNARAGSPSSSPSMVSNTRLPQNKMGVTPKSPPLIYRRVSHSKTALQPLLKSESPKSRQRCKLEQEEGTLKKQKQCNCKNTRCLKLYCECFASGNYCDGCNCINCHNNKEHETERKVSVDVILERNPNAFRPKIATSPAGAIDGGVEHNKGCNCKRSGCLKRYCECFQANLVCSGKCKCVDCKNFEGCEERSALFHEHPANSVTLIKQVTNTAINGSIGDTCKQSRNDPFFSRAKSDEQLSSWLPQSRQEICLASDASRPPSSVNLSKHARPAVLEPSKSVYRSPLAGILKIQDVKNLCTLLVEVSAEAAKTISEKINNNLATMSVASSREVCKDIRNHVAIELRENQESRARSSSSEPTSSGTQNGRPMSPGTLALMCDERYNMFTAADSLSTVTESDTRNNQLYIEQEKLVLTKFHSFLDRLINCAEIEGDIRSSYS